MFFLKNTMIQVVMFVFLLVLAKFAIDVFLAGEFLLFGQALLIGVAMIVSGFKSGGKDFYSDTVLKSLKITTWVLMGAVQINTLLIVYEYKFKSVEVSESSISCTSSYRTICS